MQHDIVSGAQWLAARQALLAEEKKLAELRARDRRAAPRPAMDGRSTRPMPSTRRPAGRRSASCSGAAGG